MEYIKVNKKTFNQKIMSTKLKLAVFLLFIGVFLPFFSAQAGLVPCGLTNDDTSTPNVNESQICTLCHLIIGIKGIIDFGLKLLITVAAVGIFIAGVLYIISSGNEEMMKRAKSFLSTSLSGFTITLAAWLIVNSIMWILSFNISNLKVDTAVNWYTFTCNSQSSANTKW